LPLGWSRREERSTDSTSDGFRHSEGGFPREVVEYYDVLGKAADRGAKIESPAFDLRLASKDFLCSQRIEHRL